jgi:glycosyltransferase involved in cell wall biosynthesis
VTRTIHLLTGEYPPRHGGVGDYTVVLAAALARRGCAVHVWSPVVADGPAAADVTLHALPDVFGAGSRQLLERALPALSGRVVLQYVPNALGNRGANLAFCRWFARLQRSGLDTRVMFHEPYFYFTVARPSRNLLAIVQRLMAAALLRANPVAYLSTDAWIRYLRPYAPAATTWVTLPIPATVSLIDPPPGVTGRWRRLAGETERLAGHFGTYGDHVARNLKGALAAVLEADPSVHALLAGRGSDEFAGSFAAAHPLAAGRVHGAGQLPPEEVIPTLQACDVLIQPYPDGVTTRRTSVMACLAAGVATVTTDGRLTEPVWRETQAARLVPASAAAPMRDAALALLGDAAARAAQAARGTRAYHERFAIDRSVDALLAA